MVQEMNGSCTIGEVGNDLVWAIRVISGALRRASAEAAADLPGGPRTYLLLTALADPNQEPPTQLALGAKLGIDRTVTSQLLEDLEIHGLVARQPNPQDRRARHVALTPEGSARLASMKAAMAAAEKRLLSQLPRAEAEQLRSTLGNLARSIQAGL